MNTIDRTTLTEWLDLDLEGQLSAPEKTDLSARLAVDDELAAEQRELQALHTLFGESRIAVRSEFKDRVMTALPAPAWQQQRVPAWAVPFAMMACLGLAAAFVLAGTSADSGPVAGTVFAVLDFFQASALAGAGLLMASWRGLGLGLEELIASSGLSLAAMGVVVLFVNLLFFSMMRRRPHDVQPLLERVGVSDSDRQRDRGDTPSA